MTSRKNGGRRKAPDRDKDRHPMTVNASRDDVAPALGGYRTVTLSRAVRIAAQRLGEEAVGLRDQFSPQEWGLLVEAYEGRELEPEQPNPGANLAALLERCHTLFHAPGGGAAPDRAVAALVAKVRQLDYMRCWATLIALSFYWDHRALIEEGEPWWCLAVRKRILEALWARNKGANGDGG